MVAMTARLAAVGLMAIGGQVGGQTFEIRGQAECATCRVVLTPIALLVDKRGDIGSQLASVARSTSGSYLVVTRGGAAATEFGADGEYLRSIGRRGSGPGEHLMLSQVMADATGNVHTIDAQLSRHSIFSPTGTYLRSTPLTYDLSSTNDVVLNSRGELIRNTLVPAGPGKVYSVHAVDSLGRTIRKGDVIPYDRGRPWRSQRKLFVGPGDKIIASHTLEYRIDIFSPSLAREQVLIRNVKWFPSYRGTVRPPDGVLDKPPVPKISRVWLDSAGHLWVVIFVASPKWRAMAAPPKAMLPGDPQILRPRYDIVVEVIDLARKRLLVHHRFDGTIGVSFGDGYVANANEGVDGQVKVSISRLSINPTIGGR